MNTVKLTQVYVSDQKKDGTKFKTREGKSFWKISIKTDKFGDEWFSTLAFNQDDRVMGLKQGDEVNIIIEERDGFKNFKLPTKLDILEQRVKVLEDKVLVDKPQINISDDELPF